MTRGRWALGIGATILIAAGAGAQAVEGSLEYRKHPARRSGALPYGSAAITLMAEQPADIGKLPPLVSEKPLYGKLVLGDSRLRLVVDQKSEDDDFYNRIYLDRNGNGDLSDDSAVEGSANAARQRLGMKYVVFPATDLVYKLGGEELPYTLSFALTRYNPRGLTLGGGRTVVLPATLTRGGANRTMLRVSTGCYYRGTLELGDKTCQIMLGDTNCNGRFDDKLTVDENLRRVEGAPLYPRGDRWYMTTKKSFSVRDYFSFTDRMVLGKKLYDVQVRLGAGKVTLAPMTENLLPLKLPLVAERVVMHTEGYGHAYMMLNPGKLVHLPAGKYRVLEYSGTHTGEHGDVWQVAAKATRESPFVTLAGAEGATALFGEPFTVSASVPEYTLKRFRDGKAKNLRISLRIEGRGGEVVSGLTRLSGEQSVCEMSAKKRNMPLEPKYSVVKTDGQVVTHGSFKYG